MFDHDHLLLRRVRLKPGEAWTSRANGLHFLFPAEGAGECRCGGVALPLRPGDVFAFQAPRTEPLRADGAAGLVFSWFSLFAEHIFPLFAAQELFQVQPLIDGFRSSRLYAANSPVALSCHKLVTDAPSQSGLDHRSQLVRIAGLVLSIELRSLQATRLRPAHEDEALLSGLSKLSVNEIMDSQVGDLAQRFNFSQRHLNRLFHQHFGLSFAALRMEIRLLKAACLLRDPAAKVLNVAGDCGFNHLSLFNSCFKARFGTSPGQWRKDGAGKPRTPDRDKLNGYPGCSLFVNGLCPWSGKTAPQLPGRLGARPLRREAAVRLATAVGGARTLAGNRQRRATVTAGVASGARVAALIGEERPLQAARPAGGDGESFAALIAKRIEAAARTELGSASPPKQTKGNGR